MAGSEREFEPETATAICMKIMEGGNLTRLCAPDNPDKFPSKPTVYFWLSSNEQFANDYARALLFRADSRVDKIEQNHDDMVKGKIDASECRVMNDDIKWLSGREHPKKYGDRVHNEHSGSLKVVEVQTFVDDETKPEGKTE